MTRFTSLEGVFAARGIQDGPAKVRAIIEETARKFDFEAAMLKSVGKPVQGSIIVEDRYEGLLTQMIVVPAGEDISSTDKEIYDNANGRKLREKFALYIRKLLIEEGIPLEVNVAGKTSIDIGPNKSLGFQAIAEEFRVEGKHVIWAGDSHGEIGNDRPAAVLAGIKINVGPRTNLPGRVFQETDAGPEGLLDYYRLIVLYARSFKALRGR